MLEPDLTYGPPMLLWSLIADQVLWQVAYVLILRQARSERIYGMPFMALCFNLAWEFTFAFLHPHPGPALWFNVLWFVVDLGLLWQLLRYAEADFPKLLRGRLFGPSVALGLSLALMCILGITYEFNDWYGTYTGWGQNLMMSVLFISMLCRRESSAGQNLYIGVAKLFATVALIPAEMALTPVSSYLAVMYVAIPLVDLWYCVLLYQVLRDEGRAPWRKGLPARWTEAKRPDAPALEGARVSADGADRCPADGYSRGQVSGPGAAQGALIQWS